MLFVRLEANSLEVRSLLDETVDIVATRHVAAACKALQAQPVDLIVLDERLPPWDVHVIRQRVDRHESIVSVDRCAAPAVVADAIDAVHPRRQTPSL